ncbi:hypothetical protein Tco_1037528, partial [Tanacetum coccineum]
STRPVEDLDLLLWGDLKTMFEPRVEDRVWRNQLDYKVSDWKLYDSCGVHSLRMQHRQIYMLVEKKYPLAPLTLSLMLEKKLIIDYESEMAYQLLKFIIKQLKKIVGIKSLLDVVRITAAHVCVNTAQAQRLQRKYAKCLLQLVHIKTAQLKLLLLVKVKTAFEVNVAEKLQLLRIINMLSGNGYSQKDENKAKIEQNQERDWKERGKPKLKAYAS